MEFRKAVQADIDVFTENRIEFATSIRSINDINDFRNKTKDYLKKYIGTDNLFVFIATDNKLIASSCMACVFQTAPIPSCPSGKIAEILNVYTRKEYRGNGYAEKLMKMLIDELKQNDVEKILLEYTEAGFPLYQKLGFKGIENQMQMRLFG